MEEQEKNQQVESPVTDEQQDQEPQEETQEEQHDRLKETTEKLWGSTKSAWNTAAFKAAQYKKLVQKKIDISTLHKKINSAHADLGKLIDDMRSEGKKNIMNQGEVKEILASIDELKTEAITLEEEVEKIKNEDPSQFPPEEESSEENQEK